MLVSKRNGSLYIGVTSDLVLRVWQHKNHVVDGFSKKYHTDMLVWYELRVDMESAILREKAMKEWKRAWKMRLIEEQNPDWRNLYTYIL